MEQRLREWHAKLFYEDLFEDWPKPQRVIFPGIFNVHEPMMPLKPVILNFPKINIDI